MIYMKSITSEINDKSNRVLGRTLLLFIFLIPVSQFLSIRLLVVACILSLFNKAVLQNLIKAFRNAWDIALFLSILIFGLFYSQDINTGIRVLETSFSLLALPLIFNTVTRFREIELQKTIASFLLGLVVACAICLSNAAISFSQTGLIKSFFFYQFTDILDFQPTYFAYYLCFAISAILYFIYYEKSKYPTWIAVTCILFFFSILMLTAGRTAYIAMLLIFSFFILKFLFEESRSFSISLAFVVSSMLLICMLLINYLDVNTGFDVAAENNDYWERIMLWESAIKANPNLLFGVGTGDYYDVLNNYFRSQGNLRYAESNFNSHNEFIHSFLSNGLIGLFSVLWLLGRPLYLSVKYQNMLGILTFFSFFIYGVTEVFLGRYQGVVFFAFLHQCFISHYDCKTDFIAKNT
jgi:O-antigen ligase